MAQTMNIDGGSVLLAEGTSYNTTTISTSNATDILKNKSVEKLIKKCTCAIAEAYYIYDITQLNGETVTGAKTSESIGQYSVSWANPLDNLENLTGGNFLSYLKKLCTKYLGCTGLMFRGVCY